VPLVLASSSPIRRAMLEAAGIEHETEPANVDEAAIKALLSSSSKIAVELAQAKALDISKRRTGDRVIGGDSVVDVEGRHFDKPVTREQAKEHLRFFSGKVMELTSAVALAHNGAVDWCHSETTRLHVRELSDEFIKTYLEHEWPDVAYCVGVFRMEGLGVQLFERIEGDYFTVLGMPLIPLLGALRQRGLVQA
jgi:septum formation protein